MYDHFVTSINTYVMIPRSKEYTQDWLEANNIKTLDWPDLSLDLNLVENVWGLLIRRVYENGCQFDNAEQLFDAVRIAWEEIPETYLQDLYSSMRRRIFEIVRNNGVHVLIIENKIFQ